MNKLMNQLIVHNVKVEITRRILKLVVFHRILQMIERHGIWEVIRNIIKLFEIIRKYDKLQMNIHRFSDNIWTNRNQIK